jgi:hypothetical protein
MSEPTAWYDPINGMVSTDQDCSLFTPLGQVLPLYTQRAWVGLTDEEIEMIVENRRAAHWEFVRQVEAKLKEKNT